MSKEVTLFYFTLFGLIVTVNCDNYISVIENNTVQLKCGNNLNNEAVKSKWLDPSGDVISQTRFTVATNGSLLIENVRRNDAGQYTCHSRIKTDRGLTPKSVVVYLNVKYVPQITSIKSSIRVLQNSSVVLPCSAIGNPGVTFQWLYPNENVIKDSRKHLLFTNGSLLVRNVQTTDVFTYTCAPYNGVGEGVRGHTHLDILIPPTFEHSVKEKRINISEGNSVAMDCNAVGMPIPNITWRHLNTSSNHLYGSTVAVLSLTNVKASDAGIYVCNAQSIAGQVERYFVLTVQGKPSVPTKFAITAVARFVRIMWQASYNGGFTQEFQLWYRPMHKSDYEWKVVVIRHSHDRTIMFHHDASTELWEVYHYYSVRARNKKGFSPFTFILEVVVMKNNTLLCTNVTSISETPLTPYSFILNVSRDYYNLTWKYISTPGRPHIHQFIIEYRPSNSTNAWKEFPRRIRSKRSTGGDEGNYLTAVPAGQTRRVNILVVDISDFIGAVEFQISSVSKTNIRSAPCKPTLIFITGVPLGEREGKGVSKGESSQNDGDDNLIPAIVLACIFGIFVIVLFVSLYCFCRRKEWCRPKKDGIDDTQTANGATKTSTCMDYKDARNSHENNFNDNSRQQGHVKTCPAFQLDNYTATNAHNKNKVHSDDVFMLTEDNAKEEVVCTCKKDCLTLDTRPLKKNNSKKVLYKCSSSPSILVTSEADDAKVEILPDDDDFDVSELEEDIMTALIPHFECCAFSPSQCTDHSFTEVCSPALENCLQVHTKDNSTSKDADVSSAEIVQSKTSGISKLTKDVLRSSKSSDGKSTGSDEGILTTLSRNTFDNFNPISRFVPLASRSDIGYYSDASSKLSLAESINNKCCHSNTERSKYNTIGGHTLTQEVQDITHNSLSRPTKPPSYTQAIVDIERMSEKGDQTDSEKSFDHLLEMERQLGVHLTNSDDIGIGTTKSLMTSGYRHSIPRNYFSDVGYSSDIQSRHWKDKYTNREKTLRCNQLLEEFKSSRKEAEDGSLESASTTSPISRSYSVIDNIIPEEEVVKRKTSSTSSYHSEWLV